MMIRKWLRRILIALAAIIVFAIIIISGTFWLGHVKPFQRTQFDKNIWFASDSNEREGNACYRGGMAYDIRQRLLSKHMSRDDVVRLLGKPDGHSSGHEYQYTLGMCSGLLVQMDYDNLHVFFDSTGHYSHAKIIQH